MAQRMSATTIELDAGHLSLITHPDETAAMILDAAWKARASDPRTSSRDHHNG